MDDFTASASDAFMNATRRLDQFVRAGLSWSGSERNVALLNTGAPSGQQPRFADISALSGFDFPDDGRGLAFTDWDGDGDLDVWTMNRTAPQLRFLENTSRPAASGGPAFLDLWLAGDGKTVNRDAVGARATITVTDANGPQPPRLQTVRRGESFISQSSPWLHYGLGAWSEKHRLATLTVRWPDGKSETFKNLTPNARYRLTRGGQPEKVAPLPPATVLTGAKEEPKLTTIQPVSTTFSTRLPPPRLTWKTLDDQPRSLDDFKGRPVLLAVWASWCSNCEAEWKQVAKDAAAWKATGLEVIALNMDAATTDNGGDVAKARAFWAAAGVPFECGLADADLLHRLELFRAAQFWVAGSTPVPSAFLFDAQGRLAVLTLGPLRLDAIKGDLLRAAAPEDKWLEAALPFPGHRYGSHKTGEMAEIAARFVEDEALDLAEDYLSTHAAELRRRFDTGDRLFLPRTWYHLGIERAKAGQHNVAIRCYEQALALQADHPDATFNRSLALVALGKKDEALAGYTAVLAKHPGYLKALQNRALLRQESGDLERAATDYGAALKLAPQHPDLLNNLANVFVALNRPDDALPLLATAARVAPADSRTWYNTALAYESAVRWNEAATAYERAAALALTDAKPVHNLGVLRARQGRFADAEPLLVKALALDPKHPLAAANLAKVRAALEKAR